MTEAITSANADIACEAAKLAVPVGAPATVDVLVAPTVGVPKFWSFSAVERELAPRAVAALLRLVMKSLAVKGVSSMVTDFVTIV